MRYLTCIFCHGGLGRRYLYCSDKCSRLSRDENIQKRLDFQYGKKRRPPGGGRNLSGSVDSMPGAFTA